MVVVESHGHNKTISVSIYVDRISASVVNCVENT